ncbi:hypothetical protein JCM10003_239 [Bacteroides pyogenes JCM 10003]|nr:hypothetical protein JCM10003_239 [Bacteroides pyogenes JCM 10003]
MLMPRSNLPICQTDTFIAKDLSKHEYFKAGGEEFFKIEPKSNLMYCHRIAWKTKDSFK